VGISKKFRAIVLITATSFAALAHSQGVTSTEVVLGQSVYLTEGLHLGGKASASAVHALFAERRLADRHHA